VQRLTHVPRIVALVLAVLVSASCGGGERPGTEAGSSTIGPREAAGPVLDKGSAVIETGKRDVRLSVEIAQTDAEQQFGLMFRESLPEDAGMVFTFPTDTSGGFWMKNTLIPLSIAFYGARGRILRILDMEPCRADPCTIYDPGVTYRGALEVNKGAFRSWGVRAGDRIRIQR
jgi:uncharacterized protein